ncbi:RND transporter [Moraxella porci DSM 25326]|uniref:RND transporter n=1 Tax=Moraxella porci DSM 25326 TaxID=573983 RepID=A0A1T0CNT2_9GAMM|nr:efflux RND transporter permease subunit [Moraxella porci]OOS23919.1 RND transporter [Moraxella porci DSM 25326]
MNFSAYSIKNPLVAILFFSLLTLLGVFGFYQMKVQQFPDIDFPGVVTTITLAGATPDQLESDIAKKVENKITNIEGVKTIRTTLQTGAVTVFTEFVLEKDVDEALDDVRSAVSEVQGDLPAAANAPIVSKVSTAGFPVVTYSVSADNMSDTQLSWFVDDTLTKRLSDIAGVGSISRIGGVERQIMVQPKPDILASLSMPITTLSQQLYAKWQDGSGGEAKIGGNTQTVRVLGMGQQVRELNDIQITTPHGTAVKLGSLASIQDTHADITSLAKLDGKSVVAFNITRSKGAGEVAVVKAVDEEIAKLYSEMDGIKIDKIVDYAAPIEENYHATMRMLIEGGILAVIVVFVFLRDWRATLVAAAALPLSIVPAFFAMYWFGFSLNTISLLALTLVVGVLVDDAIVEIENIVRHLNMGKTPMAAAMEAADEIGLAVIATTFTLIAVFLPTAFMSGIVGQFFRQFGWTAVIAIFMSLLVARLVTPMMAAYILKPTKHQDKPPSRVMRAYLSVVKWTLHHRLMTMLMAFGFFVASLGLAGLLPTAFIPPDEMNQTKVSIELTPDATIDDTLRISQMALDKVQAIDGVSEALLSVGEGQSTDDPSSMRGGSVNVASLEVKLVNRTERASKTDIENQINQTLKSVPSARFNVGIEGGGQEGYSFSVKSSDKRLLDDTVKAIMNDVRALPSVANVISNKSLPKPELAVIPNELAMADKGVTTADLAATLRVATVGDYDQTLPKLNLDTRQVPILIRLSDADKKNLSDLQNLYVPSSKGQPVQVKEVATLRFGTGESSVSRLNRERAIKITVFPNGGEVGELMTAVKATQTLSRLPAGVSVMDEGQAENMAELFSGFVMAMGVGVFCIFAVLMLLFHRVLQPFTILMALPLSIGGAFVGLLTTGSSMSMPAMIGFILLMGIATKNSILLVDYAIIAQDQGGLSRFDALMDACRKRAQPIIMTTIAMGAGMLPLIIGFGGVDSTFSRPMAAAVLGGLITSTFLSLVVIPVVYTLMDDLGRVFRRKTAQ